MNSKSRENIYSNVKNLYIDKISSEFHEVELDACFGLSNKYLIIVVRGNP